MTGFPTTVRRFVRPAALASAVAVFGLLGSACGSSQPPAASFTQSPGSVRTTPTGDQSTQASIADPTGARAAFNTPLPLDAYELKGHYQTINQAEDLLADKCMKRLGFTPRPAAPTEPYVYEDIPNAQTGYHWVPTDPAYLAWQKSIAQYQADETDHPPTAAYNEAYYGNPNGGPTGGVGGRDGGCAGQAELAIGGPKATLSGVDPLVKQIDLDTNSRADSSPQVEAVATKWSACMRSDGYNYGTPVDALNDPRWGNTFAANASEIATAKADIACQSRFRYWPIRHAVLVQLQQAAIQQHLEALAGIATIVSNELRNAAQTLDK